MEWIENQPRIEAGAPFICATENVVAQIQLDAYKQGQQDTMKWVSQFCKDQTERLVNFKYPDSSNP